MGGMMSEQGKVAVQKKRLGDFLVENGLLEPEELKKALEEQRRTGKKLGEVLVNLKVVTENQLVQTLAIQLGYKVIELGSVNIDPEVILLVPEHLARKHQVIPIKFEERSLTVAMADPLDYEGIRDLSFYSGYGIRPVLATRQEIMVAIDQQYKQTRADHSVDDIVKESAKDFDDPALQVVPEIPTSSDEIRSLQEKSRLAPIIRLANIILSKAIKYNASDVHIEPGPKDCRVRYRMDGLLRDEMRLPRWVQGALVSRVKILANLDIAERRLPQDGAVRIKAENREIDLRVSVLPSQYGEKVVIRVLDQSKVLITLETLGLASQELVHINSLIRRKKGIILVTGPTGSGKTTTLYAMINRLRSETLNLMTVEDPIEYTIEGVTQVQTNPDIGLTFAKCLRAILRQDPNVILVGEIRDAETAEIAFRAAMTGHLVLSTLHTSDAPSTISRLIDIGIPRYLVASQLVGVIAQRLVRCLCTRCRESVPAPTEDLILLKIPPQTVEGVTFFREKGCPHCHQTGYRGRTAIFEMMELTPALRELITAGAPEQEVRTAALALGMEGLRGAGLHKVRQGITTLSELARVIEVEEQLQTFCQKCAKPMTVDFLACPHCGTVANHRCRFCGKSLQPDWVVCPYCRRKVSHGA
jgi:type IV pilus assembly protein PilB